MRSIIDFLLYDWLGVEDLASRERFAEHSRETFDGVLDTCGRIAAEQFVPNNRQADVHEPRIEGDTVVLPRCAYETARAYVESGMLAAAQDYEWGGMQLPCSVQMAANALFWKAGVGLGGAPLLTTANANLLMVHGTSVQKAVFARNEFAGRWFGTMCLSEPQAGSSISDITTRAVPEGPGHTDDPLGPRYRLYGNKMWISNGDHEISENIVHLVLAKTPESDGSLPAGTKGVSLFIVPKRLVDSEGGLTGDRNDVAVAGLNHKLGWRGIPNTLLNFGEGRFPVAGRAGAVGYLVAKPGDGLRCMFHMMNEARIAVGLSAASIGYAGYEASLAYARERRQGRPVGPAGKNPASPQIPIIEHADVKRMLLAQKVYVEGSLALGLFCGRLVDEQRTGNATVAADATALLEVLTPIVKSWPSRWCLEANSLAIQVHGGYGYTRDFPVEQYWRDNRLNMIHEGTHGIQALDLLGRKVGADGGRAFQTLLARFRRVSEVAAAYPELSRFGVALRDAAANLERATEKGSRGASPSEVLANATPYLEAFGHVVMAWIWLDLARVAQQQLLTGPVIQNEARLRGIVRAAGYFYDYELPQVGAWLTPFEERNDTFREMQDSWY